MSYQPPANGFRTFVIVWITQSLSVFGSALTFFGVNVWLTQTLYPNPEQKAQLAFALSAVSLAFALPTVFAAPLAGAWADRHDRKRTMMGMDAANCLLSLLLAALLLTGTLELWMLIGLMALVSFLGAFHSSAFDTSYAMLVPADRLPRANGMMQTMWALSGVLAPGIAAALIALPALARQGALPELIGARLAALQSGTALLMIVDAITFLIGAVVLLFLFVPSPERTDLLDGGGRKKSVWADVREGGLYVWRRRPLLWLLSTFAAANLLAAPLGVFLPMLVKFNLAADWAARGFTYETALATISTVGSIGGVAGGVLVSAWGGLKARRVYGVVVPLIVSGLVQALFGLSPLLFFSAAMYFVVNGLLPLMNVHSQTIWQTQTPFELQGRVFAVRRLIAQFSWPVGTALAGWAGGIFDPGAVLAVLGALLAAFSGLQLFNPYLLQVENKDYLDRLAGSAA